MAWTTWTPSSEQIGAGWTFVWPQCPQYGVVAAFPSDPDRLLVRNLGLRKCVLLFCICTNQGMGERRRTVHSIGTFGMSKNTQPGQECLHPVTLPRTCGIGD